MEAVLPLKVDWRGGDLSRAQLLVRSIDAHWSSDRLFQLHIVAPVNEIAAIKAQLGPIVRKTQLRFHDENDLIPHLTERKTSGWIKQQAIKLAAFQLIQAPFYLCLDADIIVCKPITESLLLSNGRAITDWTNRRTFPVWWRASAEILGVSIDLNTLGMGVTPEFFSVEIAGRLAELLRSRLGDKYWETLLPLLSDVKKDDAGNVITWTEYSIYNVFAESAGLMDKFHLSSLEMQALRRTLGSRQSLWYAGQVDNWEPSRAFTNEDPGFFLVFQSNTGVPLSVLTDKLRLNTQVLPKTAIELFGLESHGQ